MPIFLCGHKAIPFFRRSGVARRRWHLTSKIPEKPSRWEEFLTALFVVSTNTNHLLSCVCQWVVEKFACCCQLVELKDKIRQARMPRKGRIPKKRKAYQGGRQADVDMEKG
eukprot:g48333.t1